MDTAAQQTERDRSPRPSRPEDTPGPEEREGRSRFALDGLDRWLPGGRITLGLLVLLLFLLLLSTFVVQPFRIPAAPWSPD